MPSHAVAYHHLALQGPVFGAHYVRFPTVVDPGAECEGFGLDVDTVFSSDPLERRDALLGGNYTYAYGWVNGGPIWSPDHGTRSPKCLLYSFEIPDPPPGTPNCFAEYQELIAYTNVLSRMRGQVQTLPFLHAGRRMRDVTFLDPIPTLTVPLAPVLAGEMDEQEVPIVLQGVWKHPLGDAVGIALANFSDLPFDGANFDFDPSAYGLDPRKRYRVDAIQDQLVMAVDEIDGATPSVLMAPPMLPQSALLLGIWPVGEGPERPTDVGQGGERRRRPK